MGNQDIKCSVGTCKFNTNHHCSLNSITVGCEPSDSRPKSQHETVCASFCCK